MKNIDVGNVGIYGSAIAGASTTGMTAAQWINVNATVIGLSLSAFSLLVGIAFKLWDTHHDRKEKDKHNKESLRLQVLAAEETRQALIQEMRKLQK